jgi:hypothetical protein
MQPTLITYHLAATRMDDLRGPADKTRRFINTSKRATS